jgi:hypothetical protein
MPTPPRRQMSEVTLQQIRRMQPDPDITFVGSHAQVPVTVRERGKMSQRRLVVWIALHSVVPGEVRLRSALLVEPREVQAGLVSALAEAIVPTISDSLAPMMPSRIMVTDASSADLLRHELPGVPVEIGVADDPTLIDTLAAELASHITPPPPWEVPVPDIRTLAASAVGLYHHEPWMILDDAILVEVQVKRYGIDTLYLSVAYGMSETEGIIAFRSLEDARWADHISFLFDQLAEAGGEIVNVDQAPEDIAVLEDVIVHPERALGEAITLFYEPIEDLDDEVQREIRAMKLPLVGRHVAPIFTRVSRTAAPARPSPDEARALRLAFDAFSVFLGRRRAQIENEGWHFGPVTTTATVKEGDERLDVPVRIVSPAPTFEPSLRNRVLRVRVMLENDITIWREIEILAQQPLFELEHAIQQAFRWPARAGSFLPPDPRDGDDTAESLLIEHVVASDQAPVGIMLRRPRDFCHYMLDPAEAGIGHRVRLISIGRRSSAVEYPLVVRAHGDPPRIFSPEDSDPADDFEDDFDG